jgi:hypothetical protein
MLRSPSRSVPGAAPPVAPTTAPPAAAAPAGPAWGGILVGLACQVLVVVWIVASEIPGKVFISSWSVSMPGVLLLAALLGVRTRPRPVLLGAAALATAWNLHLAVTAGAVSPYGVAALGGAAGLALAAGKAGWRRAIERLLERRTLLTAYIMVAVSGVLTGYGALQLMAPTLAAVYVRATPENGWARFHEHLPSWLYPRDEAALRGMFSGESPVPWDVWIVPLAGWFVFLMAAYTAMLCLAAILAPQWIHGERLAFPVAQLPLEMTDPARRLLHQRPMWIGFAIPLVLESLVALNYYFPAVPAIEIKHRNFQPFWFPERPLSAMAPFYWGWTPFIVGFAYLAPVDVSFSVWFFNLAAKAQRVWGAASGRDAAGGGVMANRFPYPEEQAFGAFLAFAAAALWRTWPGIRSAWQQRRAGGEEGRVLLGAVAGLAASLGVLLTLLCAAGLSLGTATLALALILLLAVTLSRIRAEAGPAWVFGPYRDVTRAMAITLGAGSFPERELGVLSGFRWVSRDVRFLPMPFHIEALKIADAAGLRRRAALGLILLATAVGLLVGFWMVLTLSYSIGLGTGKSYAGPIGGAISNWNQANDWVRNRSLPDTIGIPWMVGGGAFTLGLMWMRTRFVWWPFHPIGYVMAETGAGGSFWFHYLLAWISKLVVLRYGGHRLYVRTLPFVMGLILGDLLTQTVWSAFAVLFGLPVYQFIS